MLQRRLTDSTCAGVAEQEPPPPLLSRLDSEGQGSHHPSLDLESAIIFPGKIGAFSSGKFLRRMGDGKQSKVSCVVSVTNNETAPRWSLIKPHVLTLTRI